MYLGNIGWTIFLCNAVSHWGSMFSLRLQSTMHRKNAVQFFLYTLGTTFYRSKHYVMLLERLQTTLHVKNSRKPCLKNITLFIYIYIYISLTRATLMSPGKDETHVCGYIYIYIYNIYIYIYIYIYISVYLSFYLSVQSSIHPSIHPPIHLSILGPSCYEKI